MNATNKQASCGTCTLKLVSIAYKRVPCFRLVREPMLAGMRYFVAIHHINVNDQQFPVAACHGCVRFYKAALVGKSASFRWLHRRMNRLFDYFLEGKIVTPEELSQAKAYARAATKGTLSQEEIDDWMKGMKRIGL
ncbi:MAG: hypothetical protein HYX80_06530 [Chloroflexi bacterium]|nr:hypothetical protein [Chloroflexota bacterium]